MSEMVSPQRSRSSDFELLRSGSSTAFAELWDRHFESILRFLYLRSADSETAAELAAETFLVAYLKRRRFRSSADSARPWLIGIARKVLLRSIRKGSLESRARRRLAFETPAVDELSARQIEKLVDMQDLRAQLREALGELSEESARAVYLRIGLEMPYVEVAQELECSEGAARVRVMRGLDRLRVVMEGTPK